MYNHNILYIREGSVTFTIPGEGSESFDEFMEMMTGYTKEEILERKKT